MLGLKFFQPDQTLLEWIKDYANGRLIIDVGCGSGHISIALRKLGCKVVGFDPYITAEEMTDAKLNHDVNLLPWQIEDHPNMFVGRGNNVLLLFARPCHSYFVANALDMKDEETEALYITIPENLTRYNDLGRFKNEAVLLNHSGTSKDNEVIYSVK